MNTVSIVLIAIAAVIIVFLFSVLTISIAYSESGFVMTIRLWFIKYKAVSPDKKAKGKKQKEKTESKKGKLVFSDISDIIEIIKDVNSAFDSFFSRFLRHLHIKKFFLKIRLGTYNAAQTAIAYGTMSASLYSLFALVSNYTYLPMNEISLEPDFEKTTFSAELETIISLRIIYIFAASVDIIKIYFKLKREHPSLFKRRVKMKGGL